MSSELPDYTLYEYDVMKQHRLTTGHKTWHWTQIPEQDLFNAGYITNFNKHRLTKRLKKNKGGPIQEFGLDGLSLDLDTYHGLQAKKYTGTITADRLGTFLSVIYLRLKIKNQDSKGYLYYTGKLQIDLKEDFQNSDSILPIQFTCQQPRSKIVLQETNVILFEPQVCALNALLSGWNKIGYLSMPCGLGKTVVLGHFLKTCVFKSIVIVSPLRILAKQTLERLAEFLPTHTPMLVDVDGDLDINHIKQCLKNGTSILSTTFKSYANVFSQLDMSESLSILDEAHHLSHPGCDETNQQFLIQKTMEASSQALLMTGTPTAYMEQHYVKLFSYPLIDAIRDNHICDYRIYLPDVCDTYTQLPIEFEMVDQSTMLVLQALFLINGMLLYGCRRCIAYLSTIQECDDFNAAVREVCDKYHTGVDVCTHSITANTVQKSRNAILETFEREAIDDRLSVIASVHVLDEGVNLIKCDSVFMNAVSNDITFVQRLSRANRKDARHPNKVASCFLWETDRENTVHVFKHLSKCDPTFQHKIKLTRSDYDNTSQDTIARLESANYEFVNTLTIRIRTRTDQWFVKLEQAKAYITSENKRPSHHSKDKDTKQLGEWICTQQKSYKGKSFIMKEDSIRQEWESFVEEYKRYFCNKRSRDD